MKSAIEWAGPQPAWAYQVYIPAARLCGVQVDGVYDRDPVKDPSAQMYRQLCYQEVMAGGLAVMDETALTLCKENDIPIVVFNVFTPGNILKAFAGDGSVGTVVSQACGLDKLAARDTQRDLEASITQAG